MDIEEATSKRDEIMSQESLLVSRKTKTEILEVDIRPGIIELNLRQDDDRTILDMTSGLGTICFARPSEILQYGFGFSENQVLQLPVKRTDLLIDSNGKRITPFDLP
jgi:hypothetical protein